jgi:hypothetical protein
MHLLQQTVFHRPIQQVKGLTRGAQILGIASFKRALNCVLAGYVNALGLAANRFECLEKSNVGGINHRVGPSLRKIAPIYRGAE